jgi:hypothetical protein
MEELSVRRRQQRHSQLERSRQCLAELLEEQTRFLLFVYCFVLGFVGYLKNFIRIYSLYRGDS